MPTVQEVQDQARILLNDSGSILYSDASLLPLTKKAWNELQLRFKNISDPYILEIASPVTIAAGAVTYGTLPTDFVLPVDLKERPSGSTDQYQLMKEEYWEPDSDQVDRLIYWTWREGEIKFRGATQDVQVKLYYKKSLIVVAAVGTVLPIPDCITFMASRVAALAAFTYGKDAERAAPLNDDAQGALEELIAGNIKERQGLPVRRKPYTGLRGTLRRRIL